MSTDFPTSPFWDFSLALYAKPGVAPACLGLQERHGADVNLVLFCLWHAASGRGAMSAAALARASAAAAEWHAVVVRGLRAIRKRLKAPIGTADPALAQALRCRVQAAEIDAEHIEQLVLAATAGAPAKSGVPPLRDAAANAALYLASLGAAIGETDRKDLATIIAAAFEAEPPAAHAALAAAAAST